MNHKFQRHRDRSSIICCMSYTVHPLSNNSPSFQECKVRLFYNNINSIISSFSQKSNLDSRCRQHSKHNTHSLINRLSRHRVRCGEMSPSKHQLILIEISLLALNKHISTELLILPLLLIKTLENNKEKCNLLIIIKVVKLEKMNQGFED